MSYNQYGSSYSSPVTWQPPAVLPTREELDSAQNMLTALGAQQFGYAIQQQQQMIEELQRQIDDQQKRNREDEKARNEQEIQLRRKHREELEAERDKAAKRLTAQRQRTQSIIFGLENVIGALEAGRPLPHMPKVRTAAEKKLIGNLAERLGGLLEDARAAERAAHPGFTVNISAVGSDG
jgi:exonuclease VII large subunit